MMLIRLTFARLPSLTLPLSAIGPRFAADPVFPPGIRVGLTPLVGLSRAKTFVGFETEDQGVKVLVAELPAEAYNEVMNAFKANPAAPAASSRRASRPRPALPITPSKPPGTAPPTCGAIR